jgi:lactate dehydrogenase-like 2-hydroxyacid dehydrogenase
MPARELNRRHCKQRLPGDPARAAIAGADMRTSRALGCTPPHTRNDYVDDVTPMDQVLRAGRFEPTYEAELAARYGSISTLPEEPDRAEFLSRRGGRFRAILTAGPHGADAQLIDALPNLGAIVNIGAGVDAIDLDAAADRGIGVSNTPDVLSDTVADTALGLILMTLRRFGAAERYVRAGRWSAEGPFPYGRDLTGARVGILGLGRIGTSVATRLLAFGCEIAYHNRHRVGGCAYRYVESPVALAAAVDVLVVATTGDAAYPLVDRSVLESLGPNGYLINIARGSVVDQDALIELLDAGALAGAGLDVFADEPNVPAALRDSDNVVVFPHIGSATARTRAAMVQLAIGNLESYLSTGELLTPVLKPKPNSLDAATE